MKNSETGEYELVIGNKQVVSAFFIVALLCGVFFVLGYVVGANMPRGGKTQTDAAAPLASPPATADTHPSIVTMPQGATATSQPADAAAQKPADSAEKPPEPEPPPQPTTLAARESPQPPPAVADAPGSYWQVFATRQPADAQPLLQTLKDGGMPASLKTGADGWSRIMVGPYSDAASLSRARNDLESRFGIKNPIRK
jgi:cell division septation protein DedD